MTVDPTAGKTGASSVIDDFSKIDGGKTKEYEEIFGTEELKNRKDMTYQRMASRFEKSKISKGGAGTKGGPGQDPDAVFDEDIEASEDEEGAEGEEGYGSEEYGEEGEVGEGEEEEGEDDEEEEDDDVIPEE